MSWIELMQAITSNNFELSTRILSTELREGRLSILAEDIDREQESFGIAPLRIRDHVLGFLGIESMSQVLCVPCSKLLDRVQSIHNLDEAQLNIFNWIVQLVEDRDPLIKHYSLQIEELASSNFAILIPDILSWRIEEFDAIRIACSNIVVQGVERKRYHIGPLWNTAYGRKLLISLGNEPGLSTIGESKWLELSNLLASMGKDVHSFIDYLDEEKWHDINVQFKEELKEGTSGHRELKSLRVFRDTKDSLLSPSQDIRLSALGRMKLLDTKLANKELIEIALYGSLKEQIVAIEILSKTGSDEEEEIFGEFLNRCEPSIRGHVAMALSLLTSRGFSSAGFSKPEAIPKGVSNDSRRAPDKTLDILEKASRSINRDARIDVAKSLVSFPSPGAEQILFRLANDIDPRVRTSVIELLPEVSRELAIEIVRVSLRDSISSVRNAAIEVGTKLWPEEEWPEL